MDGRSVSILTCAESTFDARWKAIKKLCEMEYWGRLWIIQEVMLASKLVFYCGQDQLHGETFSNVEAVLLQARKFRSSWNNPPLVETFPQAQALVVRLMLSERTFTPLIELLIKFKSAACQDTRDRIFGLLSPSNKCCIVHTPVNYSKTVVEICHSAVMHYLEAHDPSRTLFGDMMTLTYRVYSACGESFDAHRGSQIDRYTERPGFSWANLQYLMRKYIGLPPYTSPSLLGTVIYTTSVYAITPIPELRFGVPPDLTHHQLQYLHDSRRRLTYPDTAVDVQDILLRQEAAGHKRRRTGWWRPNGKPADKTALNETHAKSWEALMERESFEIQNYAKILLRTLRKHPERYIRSDIASYIDNSRMIGLASDKILPGDTIWESENKKPICIARWANQKFVKVMESPKKQYEPTQFKTGDGWSKVGDISGFEHLLALPSNIRRTALQTLHNLDVGVPRSFFYHNDHDLGYGFFQNGNV